MIQGIARWLRGLIVGAPQEAPEAARPDRIPPLHLESHPLTARVTLHLDRPRTLRFTMRESAEFRRRTGISVFRDGINFMELDEDPFLEFLAVAAWQEDPTVTAEQLAPFLHGQRFVDALAACMVLMSEFRPAIPGGSEEEDEATENPLMASARSYWETRNTGRSPPRHWD